MQILKHRTDPQTCQYIPQTFLYRFTLQVCAGWWIPLGEHFLWGYDPCLRCWHWWGARLCPRALGRGCCNWGRDPLVLTGSHQRHEEIWSAAGCWPGSSGEGWSGLWNVHPGWWKSENAVRNITVISSQRYCIHPLQCYLCISMIAALLFNCVINQLNLPSISLTLITVNLLESRWSARSRRRSLKAEGRIWLMVFLDRVRCSRLVMFAKSFFRTAENEPKKTHKKTPSTKS